MIEFLTAPIVAALIAFLVANVPIWTLMWWFSRRDRRRAAEATRYWELQQQLWEMERQIWEDNARTRSASGHARPRHGRRR
jgi:hypothetical protein